MSETNQNQQNPTPTEPPSAEEMVATMVANEADALASAQADLAALQAKSAELADQYLRAKAEADNARRRAEEEISKDGTLEQIREGAQATLRQLLAALERNKVIAINPGAGTKFDPHQHQAISVVPSELESNSVVTVLQKGYSISDRVLRPALVTVAAPK